MKLPCPAFCLTHMFYGMCMLAWGWLKKTWGRGGGEEFMVCAYWGRAGEKDLKKKQEKRRQRDVRMRGKNIYSADFAVNKSF